MKFLLTIFLIVASAFSLKASCLYYLGPAYLQASGSGGVYTINVISECAWSIKKHEWVDWLTFTSATSGVGNGAITFVVSSNNYAFARQTYFWLAENPGHTASISQAAGPNSCVSQLSHSEALFSGGYSTGQVSVAIQSNCSWTATSTVDWITINSPAEQSGSGLVNYSVARNDHDEARAAWIEIAGGWFYVFQSKCDFEVSQRLYSFPRSGGIGTVSVETEGTCPWLAEGPEEITFHSQGEQIGSGSLPFTVAENPTATSRVFNVTVAGIPVRIIQAGRLAHPPLHLSGEGYPDLVWQNKSGTTISWTTPVLNVAPRPGFFITPPQNWRIVANNDFDSDGKTDFFVRHLDGRYGFWEMTSAPFFKLTVLNRALSQDWRVVGIDNFDQTGGNDIVWQHTHGRVAVWLMHGTNFLSAVTLNNGKASSRWKAVAVGDFNDDQHPDVLFQSTDGYLAVWLMQGLSRTSTVVLNSDKPTPPYWKIVGAGDFNRDEYLDIVWQHQDGRVAVWLMEGLVRKSSYMLWDRSTEWKVVGPK